jgi:hypothetical protein
VIYLDSSMVRWYCAHRDGPVCPHARGMASVGWKKSERKESYSH